MRMIMRLRSVVWLLLPLTMVFAACSRPKDVLSPKKMREVLVDLHKADGVFFVADYGYAQEHEKNNYYQWVLQKNGVSQAQFDSSLVWYTDKPKIFEKIYLRVVRELKAEQRVVEEQCYLLHIVTMEKPDLFLCDSLFDKYAQLPDIQVKIIMGEIDSCCQKEPLQPFHYVYLHALQDSLLVALNDTTLPPSQPKITFKKAATDTLNLHRIKHNNQKQRHFNLKKVDLQ